MIMVGGGGGGGSRDCRNSSALWFPICLLAIICCSRQTLQSCADGVPSSVDCYECSSGHGNIGAHFCADPFNRTHPSMRTTTCLGPCVKWLKKPPNGPAQYIRTCSTNLYLRITVALVCMRESRPGDGQLCFCQRDRCNSQPPSMHDDPTSHARIATLALCLVLSLLASDFSIATRSLVTGTTFKTSEESPAASRKTSETKLKGSAAATSKTSSVTSKASPPISKLSLVRQNELLATAVIIVSSAPSKNHFAHSRVSSAQQKALAAVTSNVKSAIVKTLSDTSLFFLILLSSLRELSLTFLSYASKLQSTWQST